MDTPLLILHLLVLLMAAWMAWELKRRWPK